MPKKKLVPVYSHPPDGSLTLTVTIPGPMVPLFDALRIAHRETRRERFASRAICKWLISEEGMQGFDNLVNELMKEL